MEIVSLRLDSALVKKIERGMKDFDYATKTEFIREAIRRKLEQLDEERKKEKAWQALFAARGALKGMSRFKSEEEFEAWRDKEGSKLLLEHYEKKFGLKNASRESKVLRST